MKENNEFKRFAEHLADISGEIIKNYFRTGIDVENKSDDSPVTIADRKAEELMRKEITKEFPEHGIIGEEFGEENESAEYKWILDPIDGTKSFICGAPTFGTLIGLLKDGKPILGLFNQPIINEMLIGDNFRTIINNQSTKIRECKNLSEAVLLTTDHFMIGKYKDQKAFDDLAARVKLYRHWGDCYGYYLVATGYADIMIDPIMSPWDLIPLIPIIKGAGGIITDYEGNEAVKGNSIVAASPEIHSLVISILNS